MKDVNIAFVIIIFATSSSYCTADAISDLKKVVEQNRKYELATRLYRVDRVQIADGKTTKGRTYVSISERGFSIAFLPFIIVANTESNYAAFIKKEMIGYTLHKYIKGNAIQNATEEHHKPFYIRQLTAASGHLSLDSFVDDANFKMTSFTSDGDTTTVQFTTKFKLPDYCDIYGSIKFSDTQVLDFTYFIKPLGYNLNYKVVQKWKIVNKGDPINGLSISIDIACLTTGKMQEENIYTYSITDTKSFPVDLEDYSIEVPLDDTYEDRGFNWPLWGGLGLFCLVLSATIAFLVRRRNRMKAEG